MYFQTKWASFALLLVIQCALVTGQLYGWYTQNAWLYPGRFARGIHLTFSETGDWSDLWKLMSKNGFLTSGLLCLKGVFILYQEPRYAVSRPNAFKIVSGNMKCIMISENTKSIQVAGSMGRMYGPSITFFEKPYFGSLAFPTIFNVGSDFFTKMEYTRSAIIVGRAPWTLTLSTGESVCVIPEFDSAEKRPICLIRDFNSLLTTENEAEGDGVAKNNTVIVSASQGCETGVNEESIYRIQDCHYYGRTDRGEETGISYSHAMLGGRSDLDKRGELLCNGDDSSKRVFKLYKAVITNTFDTDFLVGLNIIGKHSWKLDLLDWMFTIVSDVIPTSVVPKSFLNKVRELFVYKLITAWNNDKSRDIGLTLMERNYRNLLRLTEQCDYAIFQNSSKEEDGGTSTVSRLSEEFTSMWDGIQTADDFKDLIDLDFVRNPDLDPITEIVWIVGHMTCFICHREYMASLHYWALFYNVFWNMYILPVAPEWKMETRGLRLFFGGIDYNVEYDKLAMFATVTRRKARNLLPLDRQLENENTEETSNSTSSR